MNHLLSWIVFLPMVGCLVLLFAPSAKSNLLQKIGTITTATTFFLSLMMMQGFGAQVNQYHFIEKYNWIPTYGIQYYLGVDGMSMLLMILTTLLTWISLVSSRDSIKERKKEFILSILLLETAMLGTFASLDVFFFYIFWEVMLIPMFILIGVYGGPRRIYATMKFFLYTAFGSLLMLIGFIALYVLHHQQTGILSTSLNDLLTVDIPINIQILLFFSFFIAFAIKIPLFPFHTWLPDAHVEAPTAGSVLLAGVMLKMGGFGLIRFAIPLFPIGAEIFSPTICILAVIGIIYGALMCFRQEDIKKLIAYSSVSHMGFVVLGIFSFQPEAVSGAIFQMVAHGLTTGALFLMVGMIYDRKHTRMMKDYGGIAKSMPKYTILFFIVTMGSIGLPGLCGFVGEFLILTGTFKTMNFNYAYIYTAFAVMGVVLGAGYMLMMFERVFLGKDPYEKKMIDISLTEGVYMAALVGLIFWFGIQPNFVLKYLNSKPIITAVEAQTRSVSIHFGDFR